MTTEVLYILGSGRNGSTILANILGSCDDVISVGELYFIWDRGFIENRTCGCGEPFRDCDFWTAVISEANIDNVAAERGLKLRQELARTRHALRSPPNSQREEFHALLGRLYTAITKVSGAKIVVDSSKLPTYGKLLVEVDGIDVYGVLLVRDPRAVAYSWSRLKPVIDKPGKQYMTRHGLLESTAMWVTWNALAEFQWRHGRDRFLVLRYEHFVRDPEKAFAKLSRLIGKAVAPPTTDAETFVIGQSHSFSGNPVRFETGSTVLRVDSEWVDSMPITRKLAVAGLSLPLLIRYGYLGSGAPTKGPPIR